MKKIRYKRARDIEKLDKMINAIDIGDGSQLIRLQNLTLQRNLLLIKKPMKLKVLVNDAQNPIEFEYYPSMSPVDFLRINWDLIDELGKINVGNVMGRLYDEHFWVNYWEMDIDMELENNLLS